MSYPFILQGDNVTVVINSQPHTISKTHVTYQKVVDAIKAGDWEMYKDKPMLNVNHVYYDGNHVTLHLYKLWICVSY